MRRLLVDTDTAADDPVALVMAVRHPGVRVEAITVVAGNVPVDQGVLNALYTLELLEERIPLFRGAEAPLLAPLKTSQFIHGGDGMGDTGLPLHGREPHPGHAVDALLETAGRVVVADVDEEGAVAAVERLREGGAEALEAFTDITEPDEVGAMVERAIDAFGRLDVLVNNAGITGRDAPLSKITEEDWERVLGLNLTATFYCCRAAIPRMRERRSGAVVNVASISGKEGNPNMIPYSVSKAGVICLSKALAREVIHDGVRVNCVAPAVIETPLLDQLQPEAIEYMRSKIPMGRMGRPEEVAAVVVHFLASDDASFVTGQCYDVSGGRATY